MQAELAVVAQAVRSALGRADADPRLRRRLRPRPLGPALPARGRGHGAGLRLFRRRQFLARHGQSRRLPADPRRLGALPPLPAARRDGAVQNRGIGVVKGWQIPSCQRRLASQAGARHVNE